MPDRDDWARRLDAVLHVLYLVFNEGHTSSAGADAAHRGPQPGAHRTGRGLVPLAEQDRSQWDGAAIAEGVALITDALPKGRVGPYQLQAAISAVHDEAPSAEQTDWPQILALYGVLERVSGSPSCRSTGPSPWQW